jgi:hypothetical protein
MTETEAREKLAQIMVNPSKSPMALVGAVHAFVGIFGSPAEQAAIAECTALLRDIGTRGSTH